LGIKALGIGHWALRHWALVIGHWALGIGTLLAPLIAGSLSKGRRVTMGFKINL